MWIELMEHPYLYHGLFVIGIVFGFVATIMTFKKISFLRSSIITKGKVTSVRKVRIEHEDAWASTVEFLSQNNQNISFEPRGFYGHIFGKVIKTYEVGDTVSVRYNPDEIETACVNKIYQILLPEILIYTMCFGAIFSALKNL